MPGMKVYTIDEKELIMGTISEMGWES